MHEKLFIRALKPNLHMQLDSNRVKLSICIIFAPLYANSWRQNRFKCSHLHYLKYFLLTMASWLLRNVWFYRSFLLFYTCFSELNLLIISPRRDFGQARENWSLLFLKLGTHWGTSHCDLPQGRILSVYTLENWPICDTISPCDLSQKSNQLDSWD